MIRTRYLIIFTICLTTCKSNDKEIYYYSNGQKSLEYTIENGVRNGEAVGYFESGKIQSTGYFTNGIEDSPFVYYYENGNPEVIGEYSKGLRVGAFKFYREDGTLRKIVYHNDAGLSIDFENYSDSLTRDFSENNKQALLIPGIDTLVLGETYDFLIRLGNRQYDRIEVKIGNINTQEIGLSPSISNKDSLTALLNITPKKLGDTLISGIVLDLKGWADSVDIVAFSHTFHVLDSIKNKE